MYAQPITEHWSQEPIFAASNSLKQDGTHSAYFCHILFDGKVVATVCAEEYGVNAWAVHVEENDDVRHKMSEVYPSHQEAIEDMVGWYIGQ